MAGLGERDVTKYSVRLDYTSTSTFYAGDRRGCSARSLDYGHNRRHLISLGRRQECSSPISELEQMKVNGKFRLEVSATAIDA